MVVLGGNKSHNVHSSIHATSKLVAQGCINIRARLLASPDCAVCRQPVGVHPPPLVIQQNINSAMSEGLITWVTRVPCEFGPGVAHLLV